MIKRAKFSCLLLTVLLLAAPLAARATDALPPTTGKYPATTHAGAAMDRAVSEDQATLTHDPVAAHEGKKGLPQFNPETYPSQVFWLVIFFCILYVFFSKMTLPQIGSVLQSREQHIQGNLDAAQIMKDKAEKAKQSYEQSYAEAQAKSAAMFAQIDQDIKAKTAQDLQAFQQKSALQVEETERSITQAKKDALENIQGVAAEIAQMAAEKIVGISTNLDQAKTAVQKIKKAA